MNYLMRSITNRLRVSLGLPIFRYALLLSMLTCGAILITVQKGWHETDVMSVSPPKHISKIVQSTPSVIPLASSFAVSSPAPASPAQSAPAAGQNMYESLVNQQRAAAGLAPFTTSLTLRATACEKADDLLAGNYWAHVNPTTGMHGYDYIIAAGSYYNVGENLAYGYDSAGAVITAWMNSPEHRANVLGNFTQQGICTRMGMFQGNINTIVVEHLATPN